MAKGDDDDDDEWAAAAAWERFEDLDPLAGRPPDGIFEPLLDATFGFGFGILRRRSQGIKTEDEQAMLWNLVKKGLCKNEREAMHP